MDPDDNIDQSFPLQSVIRQNDILHSEYMKKIENVINLYKNKININQLDNIGETPIHCAASRGLAEVIQKLLTIYKDEIIVDTLNSENKTALYIAVEYGYTDVVKVLLQFGANPNIELPSNGTTPTHIAAENAYTDILQCLVEHDANIYYPNFMNVTPLHLAAVYNHTREVEILLDHDVNNVINWNKMIESSPLLLVIELMYPQISQINFAIGRDKDKDKMREIMKFATRSNNVDLMQLLLRYNKKVATANKFLSDSDLALFLCNASDDNFIHAVLVLLDYGIDVNSTVRCTSPLFFAINKRNIEMVKVLIRRGAELNHHGSYLCTPLHHAVRNRDARMVNLLLEAGADPNAKQINEITPLHIGCRYTEIAEMLVDYGADICAKDADGNTPFSNAGEDHSFDVLSFFRWHLAMLEFVEEILTGRVGSRIYEQYGVLEEMKSAKLSWSIELSNVDRTFFEDITYRDIFTENRAKFYRYIERKNEMSDYIFSSELSRLFYFYHDIIKCKFRKTIRLAELMKPIGDSTVSLYDILTKSHEKLVQILGNEEIIEAMESINLREITPRYCLEIKTNYARAKKRRILLNEVLKGIKKMPLLIDNNKTIRSLPNVCVERILGYIKLNDDLRRFLAALPKGSQVITTSIESPDEDGEEVTSNKTKNETQKQNTLEELEPKPGTSCEN